MTDKSKLVRIARATTGGVPTVVIDHEMRMDGRGAYLCAERKGVPTGRCLELARRRGAIARALACAANVDCSEVLESVGQ